MKTYVIGVDFGTDSARAVVVDTMTGENVGEGVSLYRRWKQGLYQNPHKNVFRQHPLDYLEALRECVCEAVKNLTKEQKGQVAGIGVDATGSTPGPVDENGTPLAMLESFAENENAMFSLWKDLSAGGEAGELTHLFRNNETADYTGFQKEYSAERFWSKILYTLRRDPDVAEKAYTWVELCDWITGVLCGRTAPEMLERCICAAGHKALWHSEWDGYPDEGTLGQLDPRLAKIRRRLTKRPVSAETKVGNLTKEWAELFGLSEHTAVSAGIIDAHSGAVGAGIAENTMVCILGTSCVAAVVEKAENLEGKDFSRFCGMAEDSILPGYISLESGQASFGDNFAWFKNLLLWPVLQLRMQDETSAALQTIQNDLEQKLLNMLQTAAEQLPEEPFPVSLDWFNGRRYPDTNDNAQAVMSGLTLGTDAAYLYRSLVFGTVSGLYRIMEGFEKQGVEINRVIAVGGISKKSPYLMQMLADLSGKEILITDSNQTSAQGAAIHAAVAAGIFADMTEALGHMAAKCTEVYRPNLIKTGFYRKQYEKYLQLAGE